MLVFGPKVMIFDGWGSPPGCVTGYGHISHPIPRRGEARCACPLHGITGFSVVVFVFLFDLVQNYWKWSSYWVAL